MENTCKMCYIQAYNAIMTITADKRKSERLVARVTPDDKHFIEKAAAVSGLSLGAFLVESARDAAEKKLEKVEKIRLSSRQSRRFVEALLGPPRKAPKAVRDAFRDYRDTVTEG